MFLVAGMVGIKWLAWFFVSSCLFGSGSILMLFGFIFKKADTGKTKDGHFLITLGRLFWIAGLGIFLLLLKSVPTLF